MRAGVVAAVGVLLLGGCTSFSAQVDERTGTGGGGDARVATAAPRDPLTVVPDADPVAAAVGASRSLFRHAEVAVVARAGDLPGTLLGASAAVGLRVPLLLVPRGGELGTDPLRAELDRLGSRTVLAVGAAAGAAGDGRTVVAVPARPDAVARAAGLRFGNAPPVADDGEVAAVARLDPASPAALRPAGGVSAGVGPAGGGQAGAGASGGSGPSGGDRLPALARPEPQEGVTVLATAAPEAVAGVATARAAGARVQVLPGPPDPRTSSDAVTALADHRTSAVVALGAGLAGNPDLGWEVATARTGTRLPGGGQTLFPGRLLVALYGSPGIPSLGLLGEQGVPAAVQRARGQAAAYDHLVDVPVVPAFEIIVTVASSAAGPDGNYSTELDPEAVRPWVDAARDAGIYVVLDLQPGRSDFLDQARRYRSLLELPGVGLALDPEWRLAPGQMPLTQIGTVGVDEVNSVVTWLADLTRERHLPQKLLVVHQFRLSSFQDRERLDTSRPELAVVLHADGQGTQGDKQATWRKIHQGLPPGPLWWGWKNFVDEDHPMLTPEQTVGQVRPLPDLITYQ